ncbi:hypothetical protein DPMN_043405 [Dreissena polymorpha]|uniref:Uncharacterized protein n=1 Tax=Dreissena polymorpha TaxID=45954 RepID=A0A9D4D0E1_DREPO|nr:hypothetical protein DPMN_043405 [Dreissena polymorpha]
MYSHPVLLLSLKVVTDGGMTKSCECLPTSWSEKEGRSGKSTPKGQVTSTLSGKDRRQRVARTQTCYKRPDTGR